MTYAVMAESELDARGAKKSYDIFANRHQGSTGERPLLHTHSYYETLMVTEGALTCHVPDLPPVTLGVGDVIFFPPHTVHATTLQADAGVMQSIVVKFSPLFLYPMETTASDVDCLLMAPCYTAPYYLFPAGEAQTDALAALLREILAEHRAQQRGAELALRGALISLYVRLVRACESTATPAPAEGEIDAYGAQKLHRVLQYLQENYPYSISMKDAAAHCGMDYYGFSRFFGRLTGKSFREYLL